MLSSAASIVLLAVVFSLNTFQNARHEDYRNSNFAKFWTAGHMILTGLNPYDAAQWHNEQILLGATSVPDKIFLYPLPQAFFLTPLALLPPQTSFVLWGLISQAIIAITCLALLNRFGMAQKRLFLPLVIFLLFFGPIYLSLQIGSIGVIALAILFVSIILLEQNRSLLTGILLSILILKPSQGLPLLFLTGIWFLFKRDWKAIAGMAAGGLLLLVSGFLYDPLWIQKFLGNSQTVSDRTLGTQSNIYSFSYLACGQNGTCMWILGTISMLLILGLAGCFLWRNRQLLTPWEAMNVILPIGFLSTIYLWAYDQLPYVITIVWIVGTLVERTKGYIYVFIFLIVLDLVSLFALFQQASTHKDLWSLGNTLIVLGMGLGLLYLNWEKTDPAER